MPWVRWLRDLKSSSFTPQSSQTSAFPSLQNLTLLSTGLSRRSVICCSNKHVCYHQTLTPPRTNTDTQSEKCITVLTNREILSAINGRFHFLNIVLLQSIALCLPYRKTIHLCVFIYERVNSYFCCQRGRQQAGCQTLHWPSSPC